MKRRYIPFVLEGCCLAGGCFVVRCMRNCRCVDRHEGEKTVRNMRNRRTGRAGERCPFSLSPAGVSCC